MIVLDATIVNVALPHIQRALGFSGTGLEWIVTAYSLAFGSLLLLGGRLGDIYGRRRIFMTGILLFSIASLVGGFATSEWWLLTARAVQGAGAALAAPTALALIATTFPMGAPRNRALGVWAGMAGAGGAIGLLLGGILTSYVSWRWVFFVNAPIGLIVAALAPDRAGRRRPAAPPSRHPRRRHQHGRPGAAGLRPHARRRRAGRRVSLGRLGDDRLSRRSRRPARRLRLHRAVRQGARARPEPAALSPPLRRLHHDAAARHRDVRRVLLPDHLHADGLGLQRREGRRRLGAVPDHADRDQHLRGARAGDQGRRAAAAHGRAAVRRRRLHAAVAAVADRQLLGQPAWADDGAQHRHGPDVRAADADGRLARAPRRGGRRLQPAEHRPAGRRLDRAGRHRDDRLDLGRAHGARLDGRGGGRAAPRRRRPAERPAPARAPRASRRRSCTTASPSASRRD